MMHIHGRALVDECVADMQGLPAAGTPLAIYAADKQLDATVHLVGSPANRLGQFYNDDVIALLTIDGRPFSARMLGGDKSASRWVLHEGHTAGIVAKAVA